MKKNIFITTPIYYVNSVPHIGHAYTTIASDVYARYFRNNKKNVFFLTGTDEHGQKIEEAAKKSGQNPKAFTDEITALYKNLWKSLNISYDGFIRTSDDIHKKTVQKIFSTMYEKGDIYKGKYEGLYCVTCENYCLETSLKDKNEKICPDCSKPLSIISEEVYFFKLSKYQNELLKYYEMHPQFLAPESRAKEMINFIKNGLNDLCVSRKNVDWGIKVPFDDTQCVYVWFDALINYISSIGYLDFIENKNQKFLENWPSDIHFVGKEIFKFHTIIWPAILLSLNLEIPKKVFGHGWWTVEGKKMSKSIGNVIDPHTITNEYGVDSLRYFLLREIPFGNDGDFSMNNFISRYNSELANDLGNLLSRTCAMIEKYFNKTITDITIKENILQSKTNECVIEYKKNIESIDFYKTLIDIWAVINEANKYIEDTAPWKLAKDENKKDELKNVLINLFSTLRIIIFLIDPFMPETSQKMIKQLGLNFENLDYNWNNIPKTINITEKITLFPKQLK
jgi:methionyl-tRNA synthetase